MRKFHPWWNRKNVLSNRKVQIQLASIFLVWFLAFLSVFGGIFAFNYGAFSEKAEGLPIHDQLLTKMLLVQQSQNLFLWYGLAALAYILLTWLYLLVYAHRLTGPVAKLIKVLKEASKQGEVAKPIRFRKSDAFHELADAFNEYNERLKK